MHTIPFSSLCQEALLEMLFFAQAVEEVFKRTKDVPVVAKDSFLGE